MVVIGLSVGAFFGLFVPFLYGRDVGYTPILTVPAIESVHAEGPEVVVGHAIHQGDLGAWHGAERTVESVLKAGMMMR